VTGRCHGPGCQARTDMDFHSAECAAAWHSQYWTPPTEPVDHTATQSPPPQPAEHPASSIVDDIRAAYIQHLDLPLRGPFKLTRWQRDAVLYCAGDGLFRWRTDDTVLDLTVCPVELVATVEGSTPYHLKAVRIAEACGQAAAYPQVAPEESRVAQSA
jgi:hypothetical protein